MQQQLLPLFPLQVVLFPRTPLPLHIFEDRYKEMIGEAIANQTEIGIVLGGEKGILNTGCTAVVEKVLERYSDGRMDIVVIGKRRFEIFLLNDEKSYLRGAVEFFDDDESEPPPSEIRDKALEGFEQLRTIEPDSAVLDPELNDVQLSFQLAQAVPDLNFRQTLLNLRSEAERMKQLAHFLPGYIGKQREIVHARQIAPLNGHGRPPAGLE